MIPVVATLAAGVSADHFAEGRSLALTLAQEQIEILKAGSYAGIISSSGVAVAGFTDYQRQVTVSGGNGLKHVTVIVDWTFKGQAQQISVDTLVADPAGA
ncbi:MAG: hypothetical protein HQL17_03765 [Candidatus Omnitrophica bacterium]|nr:hypothetical protein [Candidatus Omnitrophota bacterium]